MMDLKPMKGYALVRLDKYDSGLTTSKEKYAIRSKGTLISGIFRDDGVWSSMLNGAIGSTVYFAPFEEGEPINYNGEEFVFIPIKKIRGVRYAKKKPSA